MQDFLATLLPLLLQAVAAGVLALGGFVIQRLAGWLKLRADSEVRAYLQQGLDLAVQYGQAEARRRVLAGAVPREAVGEAAADLARDYAQDRWPDALARFGIDADALGQMVRARLPKPAMAYPDRAG